MGLQHGGCLDSHSPSSVAPPASHRCGSQSPRPPAHFAVFARCNTLTGNTLRHQQRAHLLRAPWWAVRVTSLWAVGGRTWALTGGSRAHCRRRIAAEQPPRIPPPHTRAQAPRNPRCGGARSDQPAARDARGSVWTRGLDTVNHRVNTLRLNPLWGCSKRAVVDPLPETRAHTRMRSGLSE